MRNLQWKDAKLLGNGAFAKVYLVQDTGKNNFACKVSDKISMLRREAEIHQGIQSEAIPCFYDYWEEEGLGYLLMEHVKGINLERHIKENGPLSEQQTIRVGIEVANVLKQLHERKDGPVVYRDVKPENILWENQEKVRVVDFGCVCPFGRNGEIAGTVGYAAPEQMESGSILGPACDVYGLGKTLQKLCGGKVSGRLRKLIKRCTREECSQRIPDMKLMIKLLQYCESPRVCLTKMERAVWNGEFLVLKNILEKN